MLPQSLPESFGGIELSDVNASVCIEFFEKREPTIVVMALTEHGQLRFTRLRELLAAIQLQVGLESKIDCQQVLSGAHIFGPVQLGAFDGVRSQRLLKTDKGLCALVKHWSRRKQERILSRLTRVLRELCARLSSPESRYLKELAACTDGEVAAVADTVAVANFAERTAQHLWTLGKLEENVQCFDDEVLSILLAQLKPSLKPAQLEAITGALWALCAHNPTDSGAANTVVGLGAVDKCASLLRVFVHSLKLNEILDPPRGICQLLSLLQAMASCFQASTDILVHLPLLADLADSAAIVVKHRVVETVCLALSHSNTATVSFASRALDKVDTSSVLEVDSQGRDRLGAALSRILKGALSGVVDIDIESEATVDDYAGQDVSLLLCASRIAVAVALLEDGEESRTTSGDGSLMLTANVLKASLLCGRWALTMYRSEPQRRLVGGGAIGFSGSNHEAVEDETSSHSSGFDSEDVDTAVERRQRVARAKLDLVWKTHPALSQALRLAYDAARSCDGIKPASDTDGVVKSGESGHSNARPKGEACSYTISAEFCKAWEAGLLRASPTAKNHSRTSACNVVLVQTAATLWKVAVARRKNSKDNGVPLTENALLMMCEIARFVRSVQEEATSRRKREAVRVARAFTVSNSSSANKNRNQNSRATEVNTCLDNVAMRHALRFSVCALHAACSKSVVHRIADQSHIFTSRATRSILSTLSEIALFPLHDVNSSLEESIDAIEEDEYARAEQVRSYALRGLGELCVNAPLHTLPSHMVLQKPWGVDIINLVSIVHTASQGWISGNNNNPARRAIRWSKPEEFGCGVDETAALMYVVFRAEPANGPFGNVLSRLVNKSILEGATPKMTQRELYSKLLPSPSLQKLAVSIRNLQWHKSNQHIKAALHLACTVWFLARACCCSSQSSTDNLAFTDQLSPSEYRTAMRQMLPAIRHACQAALATIKISSSSKNGEGLITFKGSSSVCLDQTIKDEANIGHMREHCNEQRSVMILQGLQFLLASWRLTITKNVAGVHDSLADGGLEFLWAGFIELTTLIALHGTSSAATDTSILDEEKDRAQCRAQIAEWGERTGLQILHLLREIAIYGGKDVVASMVSLGFLTRLECAATTSSRQHMHFAADDTRLPASLRKCAATVLLELGKHVGPLIDAENEGLQEDSDEIERIRKCLEKKRQEKKIAVGATSQAAMAREQIIVRMLKAFLFDDSAELCAYGARLFARLRLSEGGLILLRRTGCVRRLLECALGNESVTGVEDPNRAVQCSALLGLVAVTNNAGGAEFVARVGLYALLKLAWTSGSEKRCEHVSTSRCHIDKLMQKLVSRVLRQLNAHPANRTRMYKAELRVRAMAGWADKSYWEEQTDAAPTSAGSPHQSTFSKREILICEEELSVEDSSVALDDVLNFDDLLSGSNNIYDDIDFSQDAKQSDALVSPRSIQSKSPPQATLRVEREVTTLPSKDMVNCTNAHSRTPLTKVLSPPQSTLWKYRSFIPQGGHNDGRKKTRPVSAGVSRCPSKFKVSGGIRQKQKRPQSAQTRSTLSPPGKYRYHKQTITGQRAKNRSNQSKQMRPASASPTIHRSLRRSMNTETHNNVSPFSTTQHRIAERELLQRLRQPVSSMWASSPNIRRRRHRPSSAGAAIERSKTGNLRRQPCQKHDTTSSESPSCHDVQGKGSTVVKLDAEENPWNPRVQVLRRPSNDISGKNEGVELLASLPSGMGSYRFKKFGSSRRKAGTDVMSSKRGPKKVGLFKWNHVDGARVYADMHLFTPITSKGTKRSSNGQVYLFRSGEYCDIIGFLNELEELFNSAKKDIAGTAPTTLDQLGITGLEKIVNKSEMNGSRVAQILVDSFRHSSLLPVPFVPECPYPRCHSTRENSSLQSEPLVTSMQLVGEESRSPSLWGVDDRAACDGSIRWSVEGKIMDAAIPITITRPPQAEAHLSQAQNEEIMKDSTSGYLGDDLNDSTSEQLTCELDSRKGCVSKNSVCFGDKTDEFDAASSDLFGKRGDECDAGSVLDSNAYVFENCFDNDFAILMAKPRFCRWLNRALTTILPNSQSTRSLHNGVISSNGVDSSLTCNISIGHGNVEELIAMSKELCKFLRARYKWLTRVFRFYSSLSSQHDPLELSMNYFSTFVNDSGIRDKRLVREADCDTMFVSVNAADVDVEALPADTRKAHQNVVDHSTLRWLQKRTRSLVRFEFLEVILRLAREKYRGVELKEACKMLLDQCIEDVYKNEPLVETDHFREYRLYNTSTHAVLLEHKTALKQLFVKYSGSAKGSFGVGGVKGKRISRKDWFLLWDKLGLSTKNFSKREMNMSFILSGFECISPTADWRSAISLTFAGFLEAIARVSEMIYIPTVGR